MNTSPASNRKEPSKRPAGAPASEAEERLSQLLAFAQETDLQEVVWEKNGTRIAFRRSAVPAPEAPGAAAASSGESLPPEAPAPAPLVIRSTMVGTFYRSDSPDRPPFVVEGTQVQSGQPVAAIEAMKIMKDVLSPAPCIIIKALVPNGHPVEYGQPLFEIRPETSNV